MKNHAYNCSEHIELLIYEHQLMRQKKSLLKEDPIKHSQLMFYSARIQDHFHWSHRDKYLQLITSFLTSRISGKEFDEKFLKIVNEIGAECRLFCQNYEELKLIELNPKSYGCGNWISDIYWCCDEFYEYYNPDEEYDPVLKTEEQLRDAVASLLPEIQKYF